MMDDDSNRAIFDCPLFIDQTIYEGLPLSDAIKENQVD